MPKVTITKKKVVNKPLVFSELAVGTICQFKYNGDKTAIIGLVIDIGTRLEPKTTFMPITGAGVGRTNQDVNFRNWGDFNGLNGEDSDGQFLPMDDVKITLEN